MMRHYLLLATVTTLLALTACQGKPQIDPEDYEGWCYTFDLGNMPIQDNPAIQPYFNIVEGVQIPSGLATGSNGQLSATYVHDSIVEIEQVEVDVQVDVTAYIPGLNYDVLGQIEIFGITKDVDLLNFDDDHTATLVATPGSANIAGSRASVVLVTDANVTVRIKRLTVYGKSSRTSPFPSDDCGGPPPTPTATRISLDTPTPTPTGTQTPTLSPTPTNTPDDSPYFYVLPVNWVVDASTYINNGFWWHQYVIENRPDIGSAEPMGFFLDNQLSSQPRYILVTVGENGVITDPSRATMDNNIDALGGLSFNPGVTCLTYNMTASAGTQVCDLFNIDYESRISDYTNQTFGDQFLIGNYTNAGQRDNIHKYFQVKIEESFNDGWNFDGTLTLTHLILHGKRPDPTPTPTITPTSTATETTQPTVTPDGSLEFYAVPVTILDGNLTKTIGSSSVEGVFDLDIPNTNHPLVGWILKADIDPDTQTVDSSGSKYGINRLVNGDFQYGFDNWFSNSGNINITEVNETVQIQRSSSDGTNPWIGQIVTSINASAGQSYGLAIDLSSNKAATSANLVFRGLDNLNQNVQANETCSVTVGTSTERTVFRVESLADWSKIQVRVEITDTDTTKIVTVDNAELRPVPSDFGGVDCAQGASLPDALADAPLGASLAHDDLHCIVVIGFSETPCTTVRDNQYISYDTFSLMSVAYYNDSDLSRWVGPLSLGATITGSDAATANLTTAYAIFRRINLDAGGTLTPIPDGVIPTTIADQSTSEAITATSIVAGTATATAQGTSVVGTPGDGTPGDGTPSDGTGVPGDGTDTPGDGTPGDDLSGDFTGDGGGLTVGELDIISSVTGFYTTGWAWIRLGIALPTDLFAAWNTAPVADVAVLPDCLAAPEDSNICAVYYILDNTIFDGTLGGLIIPAIVIYIDAAILFTILGYIRVIIAWLRNLLDS